MYYHRCESCGYYNPVVTEYMVYCGKCKTHLTNNYIDWIGNNPQKDFDAYKHLVCIPESAVPVQSSSESKLKDHEAEPEKKSGVKKRQGLSKTQLIGIIIGALTAGVFGYLGKKVGFEVKEKWQEIKMGSMYFASSDTSGWKSFTCADANFLMLFPEEPKEHSQIVETEIGNLEVKQYVFEPQLGKDANVLYGSGFTIYPVDIIDSRQMGEEQLSEFFTNSINGTVSNVQGRLLSTHIIKYKDYPGREIKIDVKDGLAVIKMRSYLIQNKMYILQVISPSKNTFNKSVNYFLDSFEVVE
uniref:hypothetical protein n=1 Tax=uncultured Draconibacterium sp. TaxID=1573823 RepID=UPI0032168E70